MVEDNAFYFKRFGVDKMDSTSANVDVPFSFFINWRHQRTENRRSERIPGEGVGKEARESVLAALKVLEGLGATWEEVSLPHSKYALATYYLLSSSEASANLARFDGIRYGYRTDNADNLIDLYKQTRAEGFGNEVKRRIMLGTFALSSGYYDAYYKKRKKCVR